MATAFDRQISNRNFLSPVGFNFTLAKDPRVSFFSNSARIPELSLGTTLQPSYLKDIDVPGDKLVFGDFYLKFMVDENLTNYMSIHNWIRGLGFPDSTNDFKNLTTDENNIRNLGEQYSDGSLHILNSNYKSIAIVKFRDLFPVSLTSLEFESSDTDTNYFTAEVSFKYTIYDILAPDGRTPL